MLCPRQCGATIVTGKNGGIEVRQCEVCGYQWLANPINDALQQHYATEIAVQSTIYIFTIAELAALDQLRARFIERGVHELSEVR